MTDDSSSIDGKVLEHWGGFFRLINPADYDRFGVDPQDVPMGTFASEDHPGFLPSRLGGNAYGLGLAEQSALSDADLQFLETVDFEDEQAIRKHHRQLNAIYQKLSLLIRFTRSGRRYFLVPITLVAHSLREIKAKADEVAELVIRHIWETRTERLEIGLLTAGEDLLAHELTARLSTHRIVLFDSLEKLRSWRIPLDIVILPKDIFEYLLEQNLPQMRLKPLNRQRLQNYATYLAGKIFDVLDPSGKLIVLASSPVPKDDRICNIRFHQEEDLKSFLLFAHIFHTRAPYAAESVDRSIQVHLTDLHYYLSRFGFYEPHLRELTGDRRPETLSLADINGLRRINLRLPQAYANTPEKLWKSVFSPFFSIIQLRSKSPRQHTEYWESRIEIDEDLPESLLVFVGRPRPPEIDLSALDEDVKNSGMPGCSLSLVAPYRDSFRYVLDVLKVLARIRDNDFPKISELERARLSNPFRGRNEHFQAIMRLIGQVPKLERVRELLNPDRIEGPHTPLLENIPKLAQHGFSPAQLKELFLIVVGHTTLSRVVLGKLPARTLKPVTDRGKGGKYQEILDLLRVCRLMSATEIVAALGEAFTGDQIKELYRVYDDAILVATEPRLDWDRLHDLRISALGGVQNKAIREMMKLFNLFEFLDTWQEFLHKGDCEKDVACDHQEERLQQLEEVLQLARTAEQFKMLFMGDYLFGESHLFRRFLETEFHGTGHLLPGLGARAGFILVWVAVNAAERHVVNFNPMLPGVLGDRSEQRIIKIRESLLRIDIRRLDPVFLEDIKRTLAAGRPAFIFDTGIRLVSSPETRGLDISFVDVEQGLQELEALINRLASVRLRAMSLKDLQELERLFAELDTFYAYLRQEGCELQCDLLDVMNRAESLDAHIERVESTLRKTLRDQVFVPEETYDSLSVLAKQCPEILRFVVPEFHSFGRLVENWPTRQPQSVGMYVMRSLEKFQALITRDRDAFQDNNTYYQLAKFEFGPLAEEGTGAAHSQLDILEGMAAALMKDNILREALTYALLFQDIGKIEHYGGFGPEVDGRWTHAERGAAILERSGVLEKYDLNPDLARMAILLIRHHGLGGHVIQGEEPVTSLFRMTKYGDRRLIDVFVLHGLLAAAAVQEGLMVGDMLDAFLEHRKLAFAVMDSGGDWPNYLRRHLHARGTLLLDEFPLLPQMREAFSEGDIGGCGLVDPDARDAALWHGRRTAALERLFRLMGLAWVGFEDIQLYGRETPIRFIYKRKQLKSIGLVTFEKQLVAAARLLEVFVQLDSGTKSFLLYCLDPLGAALRIYDFLPLSRFLDQEECLKLLLAACQRYHHHFGVTESQGLISFRPLTQIIVRRQQVIRSLLRDLSLPEGCYDGGEVYAAPHLFGAIRFEVSRTEPAIRVGYEDAEELSLMAQSLTNIWTHEELAQHFDRLVQEFMQRLPYDAKSLQRELQEVYREQSVRINDEIVNATREELEELEDLTDLHQALDAIRQRVSPLQLTDEQQFVLREAIEFHRSRLRAQFLTASYQQINAMENREALLDYWNHLKYELVLYRSYLGKEYETLIAHFIDQRLERMSSS
ncbi:MAG: hypothetical protein AB9873_04630 [Syntrophobacteraceae bacterium]